MDPKTVMIYGANGYTARLVLKKLAPLSIKLVLAGRNEPALKALKSPWPLAIFDLDNEDTVRKNLTGIDLLINAAGPYAFTAAVLTRACVANRTHYFDFSGELASYQAAFALSEQAKNSGVALICGLGLDIAPSDCLAQKLKEKIANPTELIHVLIPETFNPSQGTLRSILAMQGPDHLALREGRLVELVDEPATTEITIDKKTYTCTRVPLADLLTAPLSLGIVNADTFLAPPSGIVPFFRFMPFINRLKRVRVIETLMQAAIRCLSEGPSEKQMAHGSATAYVELKNQQGQSVRGLLSTKDPYDYTADVIAHAVKIFLAQGLKPGTQTPSQAFGPDFATDAAPQKTKMRFLL
jgi:short subunit dehydrogenase-like uncharacterized protein